MAGVGLGWRRRAPLLAYASFRWAVVNDFGLVAFGGDTTSGLAAALLDRRLVNQELPNEYRLLASAILRERQRRRLAPVFPGGLHMNMLQYDHDFNRYLAISLRAAEAIYLPPAGAAPRSDGGKRTSRFAVDKPVEALSETDRALLDRRRTGRAGKNLGIGRRIAS